MNGALISVNVDLVNGYSFLVYRLPEPSTSLKTLLPAAAGFVGLSITRNASLLLLLYGKRSTQSTVLIAAITSRHDAVIHLSPQQHSNQPTTLSFVDAMTDFYPTLCHLDPVFEVCFKKFVSFSRPCLCLFLWHFYFFRRWFGWTVDAAQSFGIKKEEAAWLFCQSVVLQMDGWSVRASSRPRRCAEASMDGFLFFNGV